MLDSHLSGSSEASWPKELLTNSLNKNLMDPGLMATARWKVAGAVAEIDRDLQQVLQHPHDNIQSGVPKQNPSSAEEAAKIYYLKEMCCAGRQICFPEVRWLEGITEAVRLFRANDILTKFYSGGLAHLETSYPDFDATEFALISQNWELVMWENGWIEEDYRVLPHSKSLENSIGSFDGAVSNQPSHISSPASSCGCSSSGRPNNSSIRQDSGFASAGAKSPLRERFADTFRKFGWRKERDPTRSGVSPEYTFFHSEVSSPRSLRPTTAVPASLYSNVTGTE